MTEEKKLDEEIEEQAEGESAEFMGDAPGAKVQSCVPTLKMEKSEEVKTFVPAPPKRK